MRGPRLLVLLALALIPAASGARGSEGTLVVEPDDIRIDVLYAGQDLRVRATTPAGEDVAIRITGAAEDLKLKRKGRKLGLIWMNVGEVHYEGVPSVYLLRSTRPLEEIAAIEVRDRLVVGLDAIRDRVAPEAGEARDLFGDLVELKERDHLYSVAVGGIVVSVRDDGTQEATSVIRLPAKAPVGEYTVEVFGFRDGEGEPLGRAKILLERGPTVAFVTDLVARHGLLYGCLAVVLAVLAGLLTGFVFSRGKGGAH